MSLEKRLEEKVRKYLNSEAFPIKDSYVEYVKLREKFEFPNGTVKDVHMLMFLSGEGVEEEAQLCFIFADAITEKLELLRTPHMSKYIYED